MVSRHDQRKNLSTPKTIIFWSTMHNVAKVFVGRVTGSFLCAEKPKIPENRLVGIYHSMTLPKYRTRVSYSLKDTVGQVRIVVATSDLSMGVNFPDVGDVIHTGPARSVIDHNTMSRTSWKRWILNLHYPADI